MNTSIHQHNVSIESLKLYRGKDHASLGFSDSEHDVIPVINLHMAHPAKVHGERRFLSADELQKIKLEEIEKFGQRIARLAQLELAELKREVAIKRFKIDAPDFKGDDGDLWECDSCDEVFDYTETEMVETWPAAEDCPAEMNHVCPHCGYVVPN